MSFYMLLRRFRRAYPTTPATALKIGGVPILINGAFITIGS
jgi:hypothetical protein